MLLLAAMASLAIVTQDETALKANPRDPAAPEAVLWQGERLEVRGVAADYVEVYDPRLERSGYIRASALRMTDVRPQDAPELLSIVRFLRDTPGSEALGIAYTSAYLQAAGKASPEAEPYDALGTMAERLARQAAAPHTKDSDLALTAHLDVARSYGVNFETRTEHGRRRLCYDGEAFRRVLALSAPETMRAEAALALTGDPCQSQDADFAGARALDSWRANVLEGIGLEQLPPYLKARIHLRRATVQASLAYDLARVAADAANQDPSLAAANAASKGTPSAIQEAGRKAAAEFAAVVPAELADSDRVAYADAAVRVGASRWAAEEPADIPGRLSVSTTPGAAGETCVTLYTNLGDQSVKLIDRCTAGVVWKASARSDPKGSTLVLAVQTEAAWRELWVFHQTDQGWTVATLAPGQDETHLGYLEFAGWVPSLNQLLLARELRAQGHFHRTFEIMDLASLEVKRVTDRPQNLPTFARREDPDWKKGTVSLR